MTMRIKKAKVTADKKISMTYEKMASNGSWDEYNFSCSDLPRPEFHTIMQGLAVHVIEMCELPDTYIDRIEVRGVSFSYGGEKEVLGATISAQMRLDNSNSNLNLNTPHKASDSYSEAPADDKQLLSFECVKSLEEFTAECFLYIEGERAQGNLFQVA